MKLIKLFLAWLNSDTDEYGLNSAEYREAHERANENPMVLIDAITQRHTSGN